MTQSIYYNLIPAAISFFLVILGGLLLNLFPEKSALKRGFSYIAEDDLETLLKRNGFAGTSLLYFQVARILVSLALSVAVVFVTGLKGLKGKACIILFLFGFYKFFYFYLVFKERERIKKLNIILPYTIKSIAYLANVYPVNNALVKAIDIVPAEFKEDLRVLCEGIDKDPTSFKPYADFINRYDGKLNRLDYYFKTLYRMSMSASREEVRLLSNLNETISEEMSASRKEKNEAVNRAVSALGLIPVALLTMMLIFLMVVISVSI